MSKFTSSVPPASSLEEARDLAFSSHRERAGGLAIHSRSSYWNGQPLISYIFKYGDKFRLSKIAMADLKNGNLMDPGGGPFTGRDVILTGDELDGLAAIVVTVVGSYRDAEFGYRVIFQMWAEDYDVPVYVRTARPSSHWFNTIWEHTASDCKVISPKEERLCEHPEQYREH